MPETGKAENTAQDTREEMIERMTEIKREINASFDKNQIDPMIASRINQVITDAMASIPPDPKQKPEEQRATLTTMIGRMKSQLDAVVDSLGTKKEEAEKFKGIIADAETKAKKEDEEKKVAQPTGPSQSPMDTLQKAHSENALSTGEGEEDTAHKQQQHSKRY